MQSHGLSIVESVLFDIWDCENKKGHLSNDFPFHRKKCMYGEQKEYSFVFFRTVSSTFQTDCNDCQTNYETINEWLPAEQTDGTDVWTNSSNNQSSDRIVKY